MRNAALDQCRDTFQELGIIDTAPAHCPAPGNYARHAFAPELGHGWIDLYQIGHGILIGRSAYDLHPRTTLHAHLEGRPGYTSCAVLLSGQVRLSDSATRDIPAHSTILCPGDATRRPAQYQYRPARPFAGICITIPDDMLHELREEQLPPGSRAIHDTVLLGRAEPLAHHNARIAQALMGLSAATALGRLQMESLALELVATLASHPSVPGLASQGGPPAPLPPYRQRVAVDEARQILHGEFAQAHTIASLARRVRLNECYLKSAFRRLTGQTIAAYLRGIRMARARELIESGQMNILRAATFVGYTNPSMFAAAFRAHFGFTPSCLKPRSPLAASAMDGSEAAPHATRPAACEKIPA